MKKALPENRWAISLTQTEPSVLRRNNYLYKKPQGSFFKVDVHAAARRHQQRNEKVSYQGDPVISGESGALSSGAQPVKSQKP